MFIERVFICPRKQPYNILLSTTFSEKNTKKIDQSQQLRYSNRHRPNLQEAERQCWWAIRRKRDSDSSFNYWHAFTAKENKTEQRENIPG